MNIAAFIDGSNLYAAARAVQVDVDYKRLLQWLRQRGELVRASYYTALTPGDEVNPLRPLIDWLSYNGYVVVTKSTKEFTDHEGRRKIKGNMDLEMVVDMLGVAGRVDHVFLFSGDGDFRCLVEALQRQGLRVTVVSTLKGDHALAADELRRQADDFIDLADIAPVIMRPPKAEEPGTVTYARAA